ncbi:hypothetical protein ASPVEDRAFT_202138 [Aspergillus versicolor CBS 583.65]|uniref:Uncharacterized protein n=1 Tax=Aspergillus versicolor CBS 583.65 TaxID=1036611 RepID=A0A1L9Q0R5_ASPVE|nr:uncharacterized protein ASPVEDRAFT_202138 [Aspergillus versicolor CBS 583.65]OJJ07368.1 hypothetical protein ASPVEDRAFT_202138 [Aspergillus versicolor CBS 583.65]
MVSDFGPTQDGLDIDKLVEVGRLIQKSIQVVVEEHYKAPEPAESSIPSWPMYEAQRNIIAGTGVLLELISDPSLRLMEYSGQYWESRALAIAVAKHIPDVLSNGPLPLEQLSNITRIESRKLARVLRCLCSSHIFSEPETEVFANNRISRALVQNEPLSAYILMFHADLFSCAEHLPSTLFDEEMGPSYDVKKTAFQKALRTDKSRWEWLEEPPSNDEKKPKTCISNYPGIPGYENTSRGDSPFERHRPELPLFSMAMVGGGRVTTRAHLHDYPWHELGSAAIVDVGGGVGGFMIQLSKRFPLLNFIIQDCSSNMRLAEMEVWPKENHAALEEGRVKFRVHDFFTSNPVQGAEIYWLRYILHDWDDESCVQILSAIRASMGPESRILVCEQIMDTTTKQSPTQSPLPPNFGVFKRYSHQRDLDVMSIINGIERTPAQFESLFQKAGLVLKKIWPCRSQVSILEVVQKD